MGRWQTVLQLKAGFGIKESCVGEERALIAGRCGIEGKEKRSPGWGGLWNGRVSRFEKFELFFEFGVFAAELGVFLFERSELIFENVVGVAELVVVRLGRS